MTSNDATNSTGALPSVPSQSSNYLKDMPLTGMNGRTYDSTATHMENEGAMHDRNSSVQTSIGQHSMPNGQNDARNSRREASDIQYDRSSTQGRQIAEETDVLKSTSHSVVTAQSVAKDSHADVNDGASELIKYQRMAQYLKGENDRLSVEMANGRETSPDRNRNNQNYEEQIHQLQLRIKELEDWNEDSASIAVAKHDEPEKQNNHSDFQFKIEALHSQNRQLESDLQRLQAQQRNNQLALDRLDDYEETISQLQEELHQLRSSKKKENCTDNNLEKDRLLTEERINELQEKNVHMEKNLTEQFERERDNLLDQLRARDEHIDKLQQWKNEQGKGQLEFDEEHRFKELQVREMLERRLIELSEDLQALESDKHELEQQLQSKDRLIQTFQNSTMTPGSPPTMATSSDDRDSPLSVQRSASSRASETDAAQSTEQMGYLTSIYDQLLALLPSEYASSDNPQWPLSDRYHNLVEQMSTYIGTFSIIQEELDSLKQILVEKHDDLKKLQSHLEVTTNQFAELQEKRSFAYDEKSLDSDEDEEEILTFLPRAPSRQSLLSITPGEKQQLLAQNEILSSLLTEKEQELISLQQAEKGRDELNKRMEELRLKLQDMEMEREQKHLEIKDIRDVLDEKLRENSSMKKEKMYFIERIAEFERERQEQQSTIQIQLQPNDPAPSNPNAIGNEEKNVQPLTSTHQPEDAVTSTKEQQSDASTVSSEEHSRLVSRYNDLNRKHSQLQVEYESVQSLLQQKNEAYLQCQNESNNYQNLFYHEKKTSDEIDLLRATLLERETKLEETNRQWQCTVEDFEQTRVELRRITHERDLAVVEKKQIEQQLKAVQDKLVESEEREHQLGNEIERLRQALLQSEEVIASNLVALENREQYWQDQLVHPSSGNHEQLLDDDFEALKSNFEKLEDQLRCQVECSRNLQHDLEQFQRERDDHINGRLCQYQDSLREQISLTAQLTNENTELRQGLEHCHQRLTDFEKNSQSGTDTRVEKQLVKSILLSYLHTPMNKQQEVIPLLGALVGFTQEEYQKAIDALATHYQHNTSTGWFSGWLGANAARSTLSKDTPVYHPDKSFAELLIQYVDHQSIDSLPTVIQTVNTDTSLPRDANTQSEPSLSTSDLTGKISSERQTANLVTATFNVEQERNLATSSAITIQDLLTV